MRTYRSVRKTASARFLCGARFIGSFTILELNSVLKCEGFSKLPSENTYLKDCTNLISEQYYYSAISQKILGFELKRKKKSQLILCLATIAHADQS